MPDEIEKTIDSVLAKYRTVAVVGASPKPDRPSHYVSAFMQEHRYKIIPVTPASGEVLGETAYPDLSSIPVKVEIVDIFRRPDAVPEIVEEAIAVGAKVIWMQEGIINEKAAARARQAGLTVIVDRCIKKELIRMRGL